jgi:hypothetical protein
VGGPNGLKAGPTGKAGAGAGAGGGKSAPPGTRALELKVHELQGQVDSLTAGPHTRPLLELNVNTVCGIRCLASVCQ